jgi:prepilin-type N-terminal cleavage/methylation domain-containing protein
MDRARLTLINSDCQGFTLVEAIVAMVIFTLGFSGLYFFYSASQQLIVDSDTRMHANLMADRIIETIAAEGMRTKADPLNPFVNAAQYSADLASCSYGANDIRQAWCTDLNANIGTMNSSTGKELRQVNVTNDGSSLIIDVSIVTAGGSVSTFFTRKLRQL